MIFVLNYLPYLPSTPCVPSRTTAPWGGRSPGCPQASRSRSGSVDLRPFRFFPKSLSAPNLNLKRKHTEQTQMFLPVSVFLLSAGCEKKLQLSAQNLTLRRQINKHKHKKCSFPLCSFPFCVFLLSAGCEKATTFSLEFNFKAAN